MDADVDVGAVGRSPTTWVDDLCVGEAGFEAGAALEDGLPGGGIGIAIPLSGSGGTSEDHVWLTFDGAIKTTVVMR